MRVAFSHGKKGGAHPDIDADEVGVGATPLALQRWVLELLHTEALEVDFKPERTDLDCLGSIQEERSDEHK